MQRFPNSYRIYECQYFKSRSTGLVISHIPTKWEVENKEEEEEDEKKYYQCVSDKRRRARRDPNMIVTPDMFGPYIPIDPDFKHMKIGLPGSRSDKLLKWSKFDKCWIWDGMLEKFDNCTESLLKRFEKWSDDDINAHTIAYLHHSLGHSVDLKKTKRAIKFVKYIHERFIIYAIDLIDIFKGHGFNKACTYNEICSYPTRALG